MSGWPALFGAVLLSCAVGASTAPTPPEQRAAEKESAPAPSKDRYLDARYRLVTPEGLPDERQVADGCYSAVADAIGELEQGGAIVDPTYDEYAVRNLSCRWARDEGRIAECRFEKATIPFSVTYGEEARRAAYAARLPERNWSPGAGRFALVAWIDPKMSLAPRWIATDTCEPWVFDAGDFVIDPREMVRRRREAEKPRRR